MKIITISREFGSGGRELGRRLADLLGCDYYDREIITAIAENKGMDENYVQNALESHSWRNAPLHFRSSFAGSTSVQQSQTTLLLEQKQVIETIAKSGRDCVIVGRNADILLADYAPLNLFVCAAQSAKIARCRERADGNENLSDREMERKIRSIDKGRAKLREMISGSPWGERSSYHLIINTSEWNMKELAPAIAAFAVSWFERNEK